MPLRKVLIVAALVALAFPAPAAAGVRADALAIRDGLVRALENGWLDQQEAERHWLAVRRFRAARTLLPPSRKRELDGVFHDVRRQARRYGRSRALALFTMLETNTHYFTTHRVPPPRTDVVGADGVLYRAFPGHGLQFHPLGNVARLNALVTAKDRTEVERLASALVARSRRRDGVAVLEYYFPFGGGRPPWTSGMAQAAGAQAFARSGRLLGRTQLTTMARRVYRGAAREIIRLRAGPWTRLYSFSGMVVLNAQLQSILSLRKYAEITNDAAASDLAARELLAAKRLLPRFDTGSWSLYSLRGMPAPINYHLYVIDLLRRLHEQSGMPIWEKYRKRFAWYAERRSGAAGTLAPPGSDAEPLATWAN